MIRSLGLEELDAQVERVGEILEGAPQLTIGPVTDSGRPSRTSRRSPVPSDPSTTAPAASERAVSRPLASAASLA